MNPSPGLVDRRGRRGSRSSLRLEFLEQRLPLAGDVGAELVGSTLRLTGDSLGNEVVVASAPGGRIAVIGQDTTVNGSAAAFVTNKPVTSIVASLHGGNDAIGFGNSARNYADARVFIDVMRFQLADRLPVPFDVATLQTAIDAVAAGVTTFSLPGSLTVTTADGDDSIGISGHVGGSVNVSLGAADDGNGLLIGAESSSTRIGGGVKVTGGSSIDIVALGNVAVAGRVAADLGDGANWMIVAAAPVSTIGSFTYTGGANTDVVGILGAVTVRSDVGISTGQQGEDEIRLEDGVQVRGSLAASTGMDDDTVHVSAVIGGDLSITAGGGSDRISIATCTVGRNATIDAGAGNDGVSIDGLQVRRNLFIRLGAGDDTLEIRTLRAFTAFLDGGSGTNWLSMEGMGPGATRGRLWGTRRVVAAAFSTSPAAPSGRRVA